VILRLAVLPQYRRETDKQTHTHTQSINQSDDDGALIPALASVARVSSSSAVADKPARRAASRQTAKL